MWEFLEYPTGLFFLHCHQGFLSMKQALGMQCLSIVGGGLAVFWMAASATAQPVVHSDRTITFQLEADDAERVDVRGEVGRHSLRRDAQGFWQATIGPLEPGLYGYNFEVDGVQTVDPKNPDVKLGRSVKMNLVEVVGDDPPVWAWRDVPHGTLHVHEYASESLGGAVRRVHVYTPPGYEQSSTRYPVLYLLHGSGDTDATWTNYGRAHYIVDNLIVAGEAKPMIIVMPTGHARPKGHAGDLERAEMFAAFEKDLLHDLIPMIESTYRTIADGDHRALAGLSMGGSQTATIGPKHADRFGWLGGFSFGGPIESVVDAAMADPKRLGDNLRLVWMGAGDRDKGAIDRQQRFMEQLKPSSVKVEHHVIEGGHAWPVWRWALAEFLPKIFQ